MDALGVRSTPRFSAAVEWLVAALFLAASLTVASMIVWELRARPEAAPAQEPLPLLSSIPAAVPARAVSVPVLPLLGGQEIRIGETVGAVAARLGRAAESGRQEVDRGLVGERLTRFYEYRGTRFILVFEPFERQGEAKLAAIYLR
jgi:hypothetical protein